MAKVWVPSLMRDLTGGQSIVTVKGSTVRQVIENLEVKYPGSKARLLKGDALKPGIGVAIDGEMVRYGLSEKVKAGSEVHFLPAVSGGAEAPPARGGGGSPPVPPPIFLWGACARRAGRPA